ncbi:MAG: 3-phosphoserine/phosphohydroxythreonine aminotransferase [Legionella sp.]|nr:MAG: 3-phosphoserine/phosphohydroxythreonine aminotransferase [Legionella sp.]PJD98873.1 MAG: 3-phosphoserine/phosphohydroxythreonine aminotransferase [Legionella sp.]
MQVMSNTGRVYNFGAGPAMLPESVLAHAQDALINWNNTGISILEIGHRTEEVACLLHQAETTLRYLLGIPSNYHVLFLGGAARTHFAMIPMNFIGKNQEAGYVISGIWSRMAYQEASKLRPAYCIASSEAQQFVSVPEQSEFILNNNTAYLYYTPNETINGLRLSLPKIKTIPLVADMTSCLLSEPINIKDYDLIFAGAQKNIANAGLTLVIVKQDFLDTVDSSLIPSMLDYRLQAKYHSLYATPPVFNCYIAAQMFDWIKNQGGVDVLYERNCRKAAALYQYIDSTEFYSTSVDPAARSIMNVCFHLKHAHLEDNFLQQAKDHGLVALKGHRLVGGLRASLYNAMPMSGVEALIHFMKKFAKEHEK